MLAPYRVIARAVILGRTDMGITQEQLGAALGTTGSAISRRRRLHADQFRHRGDRERLEGRAGAGCRQVAVSLG